MHFLLLSAVVMLASAVCIASSREYGGLYTAQRLANLRAEVQHDDSARKLRDEAEQNAQPWIEKNDEQLWGMVPDQDLPRCIDIAYNRLQTQSQVPPCPDCGQKVIPFGSYPFQTDFQHHPWKIICPSCGAVFPTNDFAKYYASGIDEHGLFDPARANRAFLFNSAHPDPHDPLHLYGVDDGFGWTNPQTHHTYKFIAYYTWKYWRYLYNDGLTSLADAYLYTGKKIYAHKAAILLDRIADVYPSMDWAQYYRLGWYHSDGGRGVGKIEGAIWETGVVTTLADSYDKILPGTVDDPSLFAFLKYQGERYQLPTAKGTRDRFIKNVDDNILRCAYQAVLADRIRGNEGMSQESVAACALALDTQPETNQWLDWLFAPTGGAIPGLIVSQLDRDGLPPEGAPQYAVLWSNHFASIADRLMEYPQYTAHNIYRDFPQFRAAFTAPQRMAALGFATPNIGDSGSCGEIKLVGVNSTSNRQWHFSATDTDQTLLPAEQNLLTGFDLAKLQVGSGKTGIALACNYGRTSHHAHLDQLNFDLLAFGNWLAPDQGYPEMATEWPSRLEWTKNTLSHNTVVVDQSPQSPNWGGHIHLYEQLPGFGVMQIEAPNAYPRIQKYQRTLLLIQTPEDNSYAVDIFRILGGNDHLYSFHGPPGEISTNGLNLSTQSTGTYAGQNIPFAAHAENFPLGYPYLYNVRRDAHPADQFQVDWAAENYRGIKASDGVHLRLFAFANCHDVAIANGDPPQNKVGNPRRLIYLLLHRTGAELASTFIAVLEPYRKIPFIRSISQLSTDETQLALRIELADGQADDILCNLSDHPIEIPHGPMFSGSIGFIRQRDGDVRQAILIAGSHLSYKDLVLRSTPAFTGKVLGMNKSLTGGGWIDVDTDLPADATLVGKQIIIANHNERDACYAIYSVTRAGNHSRINCGPICFVRGYRGPTIQLRGQTMPADYSHGYLYDFDSGDSFQIPLSKTWRNAEQ